MAQKDGKTLKERVDAGKKELKTTSRTLNMEIERLKVSARANACE